MANSSISVLDSTGTTRAIDAQTDSGGEFQQTVTIGDGITAGRTAVLDTDGAQTVASNKATVAAKTNVTASVTSVTLIAANTARRGLIVMNDSTSILYLSYGATAASTTSYSVKVAAGVAYFLDVPLWTGELRGIWVAANGAARVTDLSA